MVKCKDWQAEKVSTGVVRRVLGYLDNLMLVRVDFEQGGVGARHKHPHDQVTYIMRGAFEVEIDGRKDILKEGECFTVPGNTMHGVVCLQSGILIDAFSPMRNEFISEKTD